uniref:Uncharacterized protein n=1 Tax=Physcomitrium patens TaxID=3218 RepID=A0A2K1IEU7_PHYPA|nr:hypothetical protein PHYPA_029954 [Physcomitrium patens]
MATSVALPQSFQPISTPLITALGMGMSCVPLASPIIQFVFFHKAIRVEVGRLHRDALAVENGTEEDIHALIDRYRFLRTIYKHFCSAEDEVILPALDSRVKNVAHSYSLEHKVESDQFDQIAQLLSNPLAEDGRVASSLHSQLGSCTEALHTTLCQHLSKEEEQVFPLLMQHFTYKEQAGLVWQFICCIPVNLMEKFLPWLASSLSDEDRQQMVAVMCEVVPPEELLQQVVLAWLRGGNRAAVSDDTLKSSRDAESAAWAAIDSRVAGDLAMTWELDRESSMKKTDLQTKSLKSGPLVSPLRELLYWHNAIRKELKEIAEEAAQIQPLGALSPAKLTAFIERSQFLADVCNFQSSAEDKLMCPTLHQKVQERVTYLMDHAEKDRRFEDVLCLLKGVQAAVNNSTTVTELHRELCEKAELIVESIQQHLLEEEEVFRFTKSQCSIEEQRALLYQSLRVMPLKLLERVLPWLVGVLNEDEAKEMLQNLRLAAPAEDMALVTLFSGWACKGHPQNLSSTGNIRCLSSTKVDDCPVMRMKLNAGIGSKYLQSGSILPPPDSNQNSVDVGTVHGPDDSLETLHTRAPKRPRWGEVEFKGGDNLREVDKSRDRCGGSSACCAPGLGCGSISARSSGTALLSYSTSSASSSLSSGLFGWGSDRGLTSGSGPKPIDHIFQFHKAIRKDLEYLDSESAKLADCDEDFLRQFQGRFQFLWGLYRAHSNAEDDIVFPALEAKEALHNVSHSYTIDHKQEEQLFKDIAEVRILANKLQRMCKSIKISLDHHVTREEEELWPLFDVHFSIEEQDEIVGRIIGTTGAEVLQSMLPWVTTALTEDEQNIMMDTLRQATRNTMFDKWLRAWWKDNPASSSDTTISTENQSVPSASSSESLQMVVDYFSKEAISVGTTTEESSIHSGSGFPSNICSDDEDRQVTTMDKAITDQGSKDAVFKPGWSDIFRMNQKELEAAIRKVSSDSSLDPRRKAYLMQNLMTSRWIASQQHVSHEKPVTEGDNPADIPGRRPSYRDEENGIYGCEHYKRNCKLRAACCGNLFPCRFCHDNVSDHSMDRHATKEMMCMQCLQVQPVAAVCSTPSCNGFSMARYFCNICKFFDNDDRDIYHCPSCNLCRVGKGLGIDFFHCMTCNSCMAMHLKEHKCLEKGLESNCPICNDFLFTSNTPVKALPCGHFMHSACFMAYTHSHYTCPICSKSVGDMVVYFGMLDALLAAEQLPDEYRNRCQEILCNDCEQKSTAPFHWLYHKCEGCGSYNTRTI